LRTQAPLPDQKLPLLPAESFDFSYDPPIVAIFVVSANYAY
jgi:hypothetical protein